MGNHILGKCFLFLACCVCCTRCRHVNNSHQIQSFLQKGTAVSSPGLISTLGVKNTCGQTLVRGEILEEKSINLKISSDSLKKYSAPEGVWWKGRKTEVFVGRVESGLRGIETKHRRLSKHVGEPCLS